MPVAIPIAMAISTGVSAYMAHKQQQTAQQAADQMGALAGNQTALANETSQFARGQFAAGQPALQRAMQYYTTLASGSRGAIQSALAPSIGALRDQYSGVERGLSARLAPGPARDRAMADLKQKEAGQLGLMPFQARENAVGQMAGLGQENIGNALRAYGTSASALTGAANTIGQAADYRMAGNNVWSNFGTQAMNTWLPYLVQKYGQNTGMTPISARQTVPGYTYNMPGQ